MKILVIGGTKFVGRHIVETALAGGHDVTLFNRGKTNPGLFPDAEKLVGDRNAEGGLGALEGRSWDAVIDVSSYVPRHVSDLLGIAAANIKHYTFISSVSVYADFKLKINEEAGLKEMPENADSSELDMKCYGELKALCEEAAEEGMPGKSLIIRPGFVVGPHDHTDRFTYWLVRAARGGAMLAPGGPDEQVQIIDGRDLAVWILKMAVEEKTGVYNAFGPEHLLTFKDVFEHSRNTSNRDLEYIWVPAEFVRENELDMPMWLPNEDYAGIWETRSEKAIENGLTFRPLKVTIEDTLNWHQSRDKDYKLLAGITPEREEEVLLVWRKR